MNDPTLARELRHCRGRNMCRQVEALSYKQIKYVYFSHYSLITNIGMEEQNMFLRHLINKILNDLMLMRMTIILQRKPIGTAMIGLAIVFSY
jgi:hypothetical protein